MHYLRLQKIAMEVMVPIMNWKDVRIVSEQIYVAMTVRNEKAASTWHGYRNTLR